MYLIGFFWNEYFGVPISIYVFVFFWVSHIQTTFFKILENEIYWQEVCVLFKGGRIFSNATGRIYQWNLEFELHPGCHVWSSTRGLSEIKHMRHVQKHRGFSLMKQSHQRNENGGKTSLGRQKFEVWARWWFGAEICDSEPIQVDLNTPSSTECRTQLFIM